MIDIDAIKELLDWNIERQRINQGLMGAAALLQLSILNILI